MGTLRKPNAYSPRLKQVRSEMHQDEVSEGESQQKKEQAFESPSSSVYEEKNVHPAKSRRVKATFYLDPEDVVAIDQMQIEQFKKLGKKPEKSHLVSEAIQNLFRLRFS